MIKILTIEREYGSGAAEIAQQLAERLHWKLWDQHLTDEIARRMECDSKHIEDRQERRDPLTYRLLKSFLRGSFEGSMVAPQLKVADADGIRRVAEQLVRKAADEGNSVIVGRGAAYYLHDRTDAFHVFIYAPFQEKVKRLESAGKSREDAMHLVETVDQERTDFIKQHFSIEWPSRQFFHMMVNSMMGEEAAVETILNGLTAVQKVAS
jgi:cytidylate kinase